MGNREEGERREESGRERKNSPVPTLKLLLNLNNIIEIKKQINNNSTILDPAQQLTLDAVVLPANAANQAITWTSSDTTYATVAPTSATAANVIGVRERESRAPRCFIRCFFLERCREPLFRPRGGDDASPRRLPPSDARKRIGRGRETAHFFSPLLPFFLQLRLQHQGATGGGSSTITVTTSDGSFTANITIWINLIAFTPSVVTVAVLGTQQMSWTVYPHAQRFVFYCNGDSGAGAGHPYWWTRTGALL